MFFKRKRSNDADRVEMRFNNMLELIKDLDNVEFKRLMQGAELAHQAYEKVRKVQTRDEKESRDIDSADAILDSLN